MRRHAHGFDPSAKERLAQVCMELKRYGEASLLVLELLNDPTAVVTQQSKHSLWMWLANVCTRHAAETKRVGIDFERLVRSALAPPKQRQGWNVVSEQEEEEDEEQNTLLAAQQQQQQQQQQLQLGEMEGTLWSKLADYYVRQGEFEMARSIYEEALERVSRVRDFSILFDAYVQLEEGVVEAMMELEEEEEEEDDDDDGEKEKLQEQEDDWDILLQTNNESSDIELALARAEHLTARRPLLLNRVLLRQNPHNVGEWLRRAELYTAQNQTQQAVAALEEALTTVQANKAVNGMPSQLVLQLAKLYYNDDVDKARDLYDRICNQYTYVFKQVDDLAQCHAAWVELELGQEEWDTALSLARRAVAPADPTLQGQVARVAKGLPKSLRLWDLLLDLEESLGTVTATKDSYNRAMELKVATPMHILNFGSFLKEQKYFEESFTAYERGVELFPFPHAGAKLLWKTYLQEFMDRYGGTKMERTRDLFHRCLEACPPEDCSEFFMMQGKFEEKHGLTKRALNVYRTMCQKVVPEEQYTAYQLFIAKTIQYMGVPATRDIYQEAVTKLADGPAAKMCLDFAKMEVSLHEVDRARAVLAYGAQLADPRRFPEYWSRWHEFEVSHGNEETFREMLRIKRSVQAAFSTVNYNATGMDASTENLSNEEAMHMIADREGVEVAPERNTTVVKGFVSSKRKAAAAELDEVENRVAKLRKATGAAAAAVVEEEEAPQSLQQKAPQDDEIDLDDLEEEEETEPSKTIVENVATKAVPASVFGGLAEAAAASASGSSESRSDENMGALERLRAAAADKQQNDQGES
jgi:pre-mRNA-splicing factor SYF1